MGLAEKPLQLNIASKDGKVFLGNDYITLKDETVTTYKTSALDDFIAYLDPVKDEVYYSETQLTGIVKGKKSYVDTYAKAICSISKTPILQYLIKVNHDKMPMEKFEEFLIVTRKYLTGTESLMLLDMLNNFSCEKVKKYKRQKDHQGNYSLNVQTEAGQNDVDLPKKLRFSLPIIQHIDHQEEISFDFFFSWNEVDMAPKMVFQLRNIDLENMVEQAIKNTIRTALANRKIDHRYGLFEVIPQTNEWELHKNELVIS